MTYEFRCNGCNGTGKNALDQVCERCGGTGTIQTTEIKPNDLVDSAGKRQPSKRQFKVAHPRMMKTLLTRRQMEDQGHAVAHETSCSIISVAFMELSE